MPQRLASNGFWINTNAVEFLFDWLRVNTDAVNSRFDWTWVSIYAGHPHRSFSYINIDAVKSLQHRGDAGFSEINKFE